MSLIRIIIVLIVVVVWPCVPVVSTAGGHTLPVVLVIESYHAENQWDVKWMDGLHTVLDGRARIVSFAMNTKRVPQSEYPARAEAAWREYRRIQPDLVILGDDNALKFLGPRFINTETPVVYLGINNNPRNYISLGRNITGVLERPLLKRNVLVIRDILNRSLLRILVLFDESTTSRVAVAEVFGGSTSMDIVGVRVDLKLFSDYADWKSTVLSARTRGYDAVVVGLFYTLTSGGRHVPAPEVLAWTSDHTPVPPFCFWDVNVGMNKTIGGMVLSAEVQGRSAGRMAAEILEGMLPEKIVPVIPERGKFLFSRGQLDKWHLALPQSIEDKAAFIP